MIHKFVIELIDDYKGFEQDVDYLERIYGAKPIKEHDEESYNKALDDCIKIAKIYRNTWDGTQLAIRDIEELKAVSE